MSEKSNVRCPACTAELPPGTVECPWCGHLMTPKGEVTQQEVVSQPQGEIVEPEPTPLPTEPEPEASVLPVAEPGLTELPPAPILTSSSKLKVAGIFLIIFSLLALVFFVYHVRLDNLPRPVLLVPIFGMLIGFISIAVAQKR